MISKTDAIAQIEARINEFDADWPTRPKRLVEDSLTLEKKWGWVLFYSVPEDFRVGQREELVEENPPFIVNARTGEIEATGLDEPVEWYVNRYEHRL